MSKKIFFNWLAVALWLGVIFYFSNQPSLKSELEPFWDLIFRKIAHMSEYFVLAYLLFRTWNGHNFNLKKSLALSVIFAVACAGLDEWHQSFIAGRTASVVDVGIDSVGTVVFWLLSVWRTKR